MKAKHTPENWVVDECEDADKHFTIRPADATVNGDTSAQPIATVYDRSHAERIVACVNACAGIENPADLRKQRDELLEALQHALDVMEIHNVGKGCSTQDAARTAIAKAKGEA